MAPKDGSSASRPAGGSAQVSKSYASSLLSLADSVTGTFTSTITSLSYPPVVSAARMAILSMMNQSIKYGKLRILTDQGVYTFPPDAKDDAEGAEIRVIRDTFWLRLVTLGDLGFAEAYMSGDCEVSDLVQVFKIFIRSRPSLDSDDITGVRTIPSRIFSVVTGLTNSRFANTISNSLSNIKAHYDLSNGMFSAFLSQDMTYSCGIFKDLDGDLARLEEIGETNGGLGLMKFGKGSKKAIKANGNHGKETEDVETDGEVDELEEAQMRKIRHIIKKADIKPGHRVLEIGSGWGSFAIEAVRSTNCTVDTITLSSQQKVLAEERIKAAGFAGRIRVWLMDYRNLPESWKRQFDRVVSIEMLEAVGKDFIPGYFTMLDWVLNAKGAACFQVITMPESRFERYQREVDFIQKWIFPGGFLPSVSFVAEAVQKGGHNRLIIDSVSNIGPHYARTLREWRRRFLQNFHRIHPALVAEHPEMTSEDIEVFKRKWLYYFCYCEVGFAERVIGDHIFTLVREGNSEYGDVVYE